MKLRIVKFEDLLLEDKYTNELLRIYDKDTISIGEFKTDILKYPTIRYALDIIVGNNMVDENFCYELVISGVKESLEEYQSVFLKYFERIYILKVDGVIQGFSLNKVSMQFKNFIAINRNEVYTLLNTYKIFKYDANMLLNNKTNYVYEVTEINTQHDKDKSNEYLYIIKHNIDVLGYAYIPLKGYNKQEFELNYLTSYVSSIAEHVYILTTPEINWKTQGIITW